MIMPLDGKVALVTGGSRGIGAAVALRLAQDGADIALTYQRNGARAAGVVDRITTLGQRALAVQADGADPAAVVSSIHRTVEEFGQLDILVNNAGITVKGLVAELSLDDIDRILAVNVRAPFCAVRAAVPCLAMGGRIISIGSCLADRVPAPGLSLYAMSKAALIGMTKGLARELGPRGITANVVSPGPIDTDMNPADREGADQQRAATALGHYGEVADVAAAVAYLAGDGGRYVTGASISVDGGFAA